MKTKDRKISFNGRVWKFGHNIDTDMIIATQHLIKDLHEMKNHTFEVVNQDFSKEFKTGDIIVAGKNFGCGSSRQQAVDVLKILGAYAVIAVSFARIFFRNAINAGLSVIELKDALSIDEELSLSGEINNHSVMIKNGEHNYHAAPFPEFIFKLLLREGS